MRTPEFDALVVPLEYLGDTEIVSMARQLKPHCIETIVVCPKGNDQNNGGSAQETERIIRFREAIGNPPLFMTIHDSEQGAKRTMRQVGILQTVWVSPQESK